VKTNAAGLDLIKRSESCRLDAYLCPAGIPTIGYGHTGDVKLGHRITQHQADTILAYDLERFEADLTVLLTGYAPVTENQFSALVSFAFNVGTAALGGSHLLAHVRAGEVQAAAGEFGKWVHAAGKVLPGLVARRAAERALFLQP
jgi:lysozyme